MTRPWRRTPGPSVADALGALADAEAEAARVAGALAARAEAAEARLAELERATASLRAALPGGPALAPEHWRARLAALFAGDGPDAVRPGVPARSDAVDLATDVGVLSFPAGDRVITPFVRDHGFWEAEEAAALRSLLRPGGTFVDLGAHVGYLTLVAAAAVGPGGRGIALEPAPANFALLAANLLRQGAAQVEAINAAGWHETGAVRLRLSTDNSGDNRASANGAAGEAEGAVVEVAALALDDVIPAGARIDVVKVDTQGSDHRAIRGMAAVLARSRPTLLVEFWPPGIQELGDDPAEVLAQYRSLGYEARVLGRAQSGPAPTVAEVLEAAAAEPGQYCTLVLRPG